MQTNWSWKQWTDRIQGETPREELGISCPGLQNGTAILRARVEQHDGHATIVPQVIDVGLGNTCFLSGVQEVERKIVTSERLFQRDPGFDILYAWMRMIGLFQLGSKNNMII